MITLINLLHTIHYTSSASNMISISPFQAIFVNEILCMGMEQDLQRSPHLKNSLANRCYGARNWKRQKDLSYWWTFQNKAKMIENLFLFCDNPSVMSLDFRGASLLKTQPILLCHYIWDLWDFCAILLWFLCKIWIFAQDWCARFVEVIAQFDYCARFVWLWHTFCELCVICIYTICVG